MDTIEDSEGGIDAAQRKRLPVNWEGTRAGSYTDGFPRKLNHFLFTENSRRTSTGWTALRIEVEVHDVEAGLSVAGRGDLTWPAYIRC